MLDLFGKAILDYQTNNSPEDIMTETSISEADEMSVAYLFRDFEAMPMLEQEALRLCKGKILDVGCGAGSHTLYLQEKGFDVTAIDISKNAIQACQLRGIKNAKVENILTLPEETFDTILLLMNGTGIFESLAAMAKYLQKLKLLLNKNGQILIDSSDILYIYDQNESGDLPESFAVPADRYYGELTFRIQYKNQTEEDFPWLFIDYNTFQNACHDNGLKCELLLEGVHFDYLARIST